ncbi:MAG: helix-turn-helix transcriptional regulator [Clostridia bacterium]|nr:helix-turn-helix transcriptional regulator [Clostridia bacterium]
MSFGKNLCYYRKQINITQEELAERLFVTRQTVSRWETDSVFPDVETIIKLCDMFDCSMDTLVRGDAENEINDEKENSDDMGENTWHSSGRSLDWYELNGPICSIIMILCILIFLLLGILKGLWHPGWIVFVIGIAACAISSVSGEIINSIFFRK